MTTSEVFEAAPTVEEVGRFMEVVSGEIAAGAGIAMAILGDRLGLYQAMATAGPVTPAELASRSGCAERYVREWLSGQAAGGWVLYDEDTERFTLPPAHAAVVGIEESPAFLGGSIQALNAVFQALDMLTDAFRTGEGISWGEHHADLHEGAARFFRTAYLQALPGWIEALDAVPARLRAGGRILDVGCGQGGAAVALAQAFPQAEVVGVDSHGPSIERARAHAAAVGVADRVAFRVARAAEMKGEQFDLVLLLDSLHDMGDPVGAAAACRQVLRDGAVVLVVEPAAGDRLTENLHPVSRTYYAMSTAVCTPSALSQDGGWALGSQAGPARTRDVLLRAGFTNVDIVDANPFQTVYAARP